MWHTQQTAYRAPFWLPGAHLQTIVPALLSRLPRPAYRRERWNTPDDDFIDLDWVTPEHGSVASHAPLLVLFHGLEGDSDSVYARATMRAAQARGWYGVVPHFRSCSGELNRAPRFYHSGDASEVAWIIERLAAQHDGPIVVAGVSLGGNALLRWLGETPEHARQRVTAAAAISAPLDLAAGGHALARGFNRVYTRHFLQTLKRKSLAKWQQYPGLFDRHAMLSARNLHDFDDVVTAPLHGYANADDYWQRASSKPILPRITVPTWVVNARNDPFLPRHVLPQATDVGDAVTLEQPRHGGHVGFASPGQTWLAQRLIDFFARALSRAD